MSMLKFEFVLTTRCNMKCDYCYAYEWGQQDMSFSSIKYVIDNFTCEELVFTGGEPLLRFDMIKRTQKYLESCKKDIHLSIRTNGTLLSKDKIMYLKKYNINLVLSLDGLKKSHDRHRKFKNGKSTYDTILKKIQILKKNNINFDINYTVTPKTTKDLAINLLNFLDKLNINTYIGYVIDKEPITSLQLNSYIQEISLFSHIYLKSKLFTRPAKIYPFDFIFFQMLYGKNSDVISLRCKFRKVCISPHGSIYPCDSYLFIPKYYRERIKIGNVQSKTLDLHKLVFLNSKFNLSDLDINSYIADCNRLCYLRCVRPGSRVALEYKTKEAILLMFKNHLNKLNALEIAKMKKACDIKKRLIFNN